MSEPGTLEGFTDERGRPTIPQDALLPEPDESSLFPWIVPPPAPEPSDRADTYQRRVTLTQRARMAVGRHPLTDEPIDPDGTRTCGNCAHLGRGGANGAYRKCCRGEADLLAHSTRTDVRLSWPACPRWKRPW